MDTILILLHPEPDGSLSQAQFEAAGAARTLAGQLPGATLSVGLVGENVQPGANAIAQCGASRVLAVGGAEFAQARYASDAAAAEGLIRQSQATLVIAPATSRWGRVLPGVAARLNGRAETHVTGFSVENGVLQVSRWYYRQRMEAVLSRSQRPWILLIDPGSQPPWQGDPGTPTVEPVEIDLGENCRRTTVTETRQPAVDVQTIRPEAKLLFVTGAGWTKKQADGQVHLKEAEHLILGFLDRTRASLGSTKSLVDLGGEGQAVLPFLTHLNQIGQTGATPRHPKGLATCCHGEEPHTVGWRFVSERRAINLDPNCGWARGKADALYVADAFEVMRHVNALLE